MIKVDIILTTSKVLAFLILLIGVVSLFILKDGSILQMCILTSGSLMGVKTLSTSFGINGSIQGVKNTKIDKNKPIDEIG